MHVSGGVEPDPLGVEIFRWLTPIGGRSNGTRKRRVPLEPMFRLHIVAALEIKLPKGWESAL
jgi:hypothetical protein